MTPKEIVKIVNRITGIAILLGMILLLWVVVHTDTDDVPTLPEPEYKVVLLNEDTVIIWYNGETKADTIPFNELEQYILLDNL